MHAVINNWLETVNFLNNEYRNDVTQTVNGNPDAARGFKPIFSKFYNLYNKNDFKWHVSNVSNKVGEHTVLEKEIIRIAPN